MVSKIWKYCEAVIEMVVGSYLYMDVKAFYCIEVRALLLEM